MPHGGIVAARTAGINAAKGRFIGFVDSDDLVEKGYLEHLHTAVTQNDADISMCHTVYEYADGPKDVTYRFENGVYRGKELEALKKTWLICGEDRSSGFSFSFLWDKLFKTELVINNVEYMAGDITLGEDTLLSTASFLDSRCVCIVEDVDYHHNIRAGSAVRNADKSIMKEVFLFQNLLKRILHQKDYPEFNYKAETRAIYRLYRLSVKYSKSELPPLENELTELIRAQSEQDGCDEWAEAVRKVKAFYL